MGKLNAVTNPVLVILTLAVSPTMLHVPPEVVSVAVMVSPKQRRVGKDMGAGLGLMVMILVTDPQPLLKVIVSVPAAIPKNSREDRSALYE